MWAYYDCELLVNGSVSSNDNITTLESSWNIIGNPDDITIWKNDLIIQYNDTDYSLYEATTENNEEGEPLILSYIYGWNKTSQNYVLIDIILTCDGYWFYAYYSCKLKK
jgi:hypothetical protein